MTVYNLHAPLLSPSSPQFNSNSISASGGRRKTYIYLSNISAKVNNIFIPEAYSQRLKFSSGDLIVLAFDCLCLAAASEAQSVILWSSVCSCVLLCARAQSPQWQAVEDRFSHNTSATNGATCLINIAQQTIVKPKCNTQRSALFGEMLFIIKSKHNHPD